MFIEVSTSGTSIVQLVNTDHIRSVRLLKDGNTTDAVLTYSNGDMIRITFGEVSEADLRKALKAITGNTIVGPVVE